METKCWKYLIEELIQKDLPEKVDVKKSFFPNGDFGDLFRYEFESNTILATLECWSNGAVSMDIFDIDVEEQIYVIFCLPNEIDQINDNLDYFFKVLKSGN